jgi:predicted AlkP superfamily phosphohydrolase/phosphomutase
VDTHLFLKGFKNLSRAGKKNKNNRKKTKNNKHKSNIKSLWKNIKSTKKCLKEFVLTNNFLNKWSDGKKDQKSTHNSKNRKYNKN